MGLNTDNKIYFATERIKKLTVKECGDVLMRIVDQVYQSTRATLEGKLCNSLDHYLSHQDDPKYRRIIEEVIIPVFAKQLSNVLFYRYSELVSPEIYPLYPINLKKKILMDFFNPEIFGKSLTPYITEVDN